MSEPMNLEMLQVSWVRLCMFADFDLLIPAYEQPVVLLERLTRAEVCQTTKEVFMELRRLKRPSASRVLRLHCLSGREKPCLYRLDGSSTPAPVASVQYAEVLICRDGTYLLLQCAASQHEMADSWYMAMLEPEKVAILQEELSYQDGMKETYKPCGV